MQPARDPRHRPCLLVLSQVSLVASPPPSLLPPSYAEHTGSSMQPARDPRHRPPSRAPYLLVLSQVSLVASPPPLLPPPSCAEHTGSSMQPARDPRHTWVLRWGPPLVPLS